MKFWKRCMEILGIIAFCLFMLIALPLSGLVGLIALPFDIARYHKTPYYKEQKIKYFKKSDYVSELYDHMRNNDRPLTYVRNAESEYFIKEGTVLCFFKVYDDVIEHDGVWCFLDSDKGAEERYTPIEEVLEKYRAKLNEEHSALPIKIVIFYDEADTTADVAWQQTLAALPYFLGVDSLYDL